MNNLELTNLLGVKFSDLGWKKHIRYIKAFELISIDTNTGYQLMFHQSKLVHSNILNNKRLLTDSVAKKDNILWVQDENILVQKSIDFQKYLNKEPEFLNKEPDFSYNYHPFKLNKLYFIDKQYLIKYLPNRNLVAIFGMAHNSVGKGKTTHWSSRACFTVWNLLTSEKVFEFFPDYPWADFSKLEFSSDEKYIYISQVYEWEDLYLFRLEDYKLIYRDGYIHPNPTETGSSFGCFYQDKFVIPSKAGYDGWMGNFRYVDLKDGSIHYIFEKEAEPEFDIWDGKICDDICYLNVGGQLKSFNITSILEGDFKEIPLSTDIFLQNFYWENNSNHNAIDSFDIDMNCIAILDTNGKLHVGSIKSII